MSDEDGGRSENRVVPTSVGGSQAATGAACPIRGSRRHRARPRLLSEDRRTILESADAGEALASVAELPEAPIPQTIHRAALLSELEPHDRQEPPLGREAAWAHHLHDAAG